MASKKLGHLEAGKKKLEEFRRKKLEGKAKKTASTGQLAPVDADQHENVSQNNEHTSDVSRLDTHSPGLPDESNAVNSFESTDIYSSNRTHGSSPVMVENNHVSSNESVPKLYESSGFPDLANGYYDRLKENSEPSQHKDIEVEPHIIMNSTNSNIHSSVEDSNSNDGYSLKFCMGPDRVSVENRWGLPPLPSTSAYSSGAHKELSPEVDPYSNNALDYSMGGGKVVGNIDHKFSVDSTPWQASEPSYNDYSLAYKGTQYEYPFASTGHGTSTSRSRPSFLDSLGVSRSPMVNTSVPFDSTKTQSTENPWSNSPGQKFSEFSTTDQSFKPITHDSINDKELSMNAFISSNDEYAKRDQELFTSKKDENFAALEQHIEDLTQEKFSLQRALETSRALSESLATENSSLTESYNLQGLTVGQLRSDMERYQEEIKAQLLALESLRSEYMNAQLECNAADERAKILASEVIGLEEKALRLRSNELKLENQLENLKSEVASYKRKVSIMEKERQDFQSTIDALQEEKKVLHFKMRGVSLNEKVDAKATTTRRDVCTSTEDLGETSISEHRVEENATIPTSTDASSSSMMIEDNTNEVPDASVDIPLDQLRMIENINSLISELALEKEELVGALKIESSNCTRLKDLNKELSQKLEVQTQRLELLTAQRMANDNSLARSVDTHSIQDTAQYADEGDEVVERVLGWIMKLFPGGPSKRRTSKLL